MGDDILIGGSTTFDGDAAFTALNAIMSEWTSNQTYVRAACTCSAFWATD